MTRRIEQQWEYLIFYSFDRGTDAYSWTFQVCATTNRFSLEHLGKEGWELTGVSHDGERYIFKRPKQSGEI